MFSCRTKEDILVCLKYCLSHVSDCRTDYARKFAHARTLENSGDGDMTKLSLEVDQEMRLWMLRSSSMLASVSRYLFPKPIVLYLYSLCMKAVCTTFGC